MKTKEIFLQKLRESGYKNDDFWRCSDFDKQLIILEKDAENVFHNMYGDTLLKDRGTGEVKEYIYRYLEAKQDVKDKHILITMHYLIMQIHTGALKI